MSRNPYTGEASNLGPLFSKPLARTTDPKSSHIAAHDMRSSGALGRQCEEVEAALREYLDLYGSPPTTRELCKEVSLTSNPYELEGLVRIYGKRLSDLEHAGRVRRTGLRACRVRHRAATTWEPTS